MIPGLSTGGGGFSSSSSAESGVSGGSVGTRGDLFSDRRGDSAGSGLFNNTGIKFGNKGINMNAVLAVVGLVAIVYILKR